MKTGKLPAVQCRFEDRLNSTALEMREPLAHITAIDKRELPQALAQVSTAQARGHWVALALDYELGYWLDPALDGLDKRKRQPRGQTVSDHRITSVLQSGKAAPALSAWVFAAARKTHPWDAPTDIAASRLHSIPSLPEKATVRKSTTDLWLHATPAIARDDYLTTVTHLRARMAQGDFYQVNYTFPLNITSNASPEQLYRIIANRHPAAHAVYFEDAHRTIASFSPELFVKRHGDKLTVRPMKGTAPRVADPMQDRHLAEALLASPKNRAENLMIVDLLRNDLGRLAIPGSVKVDALFSLEQYPSVWTLTSTISARQSRDHALGELLAALFPCGSITGAPKIAAMHAIAAVELHPRGIYCGSLGWLAPNGDFSLNVAIRTLELQQNTDNGLTCGVYGVGGGIVMDSDPVQEWEECLWKARVLA